MPRAQQLPRWDQSLGCVHAAHGNSGGAHYSKSLHFDCVPFYLFFPPPSVIGLCDAMHPVFPLHQWLKLSGGTGGMLLRLITVAKKN